MMINLNNNEKTNFINLEKINWIELLKCDEGKKIKLKHKMLEKTGAHDNNFKIILFSNYYHFIDAFLDLIFRSYANIKKIIPHVLCSTFEDKYLIDWLCIKNNEQKLEVNFLPLDIHGNLDLFNIENSIQINTMLVIVSHSNKDVGNINNIIKIGEITRKHNIPLFSDCTDYARENKLNIRVSNVDITLLNHNRLYSTDMISVIVNTDLIQGYKLKNCIINDNRNISTFDFSYLPMIKLSVDNYEEVLKQRIRKNNYLNKLKNKVVGWLKIHFLKISLEKILQNDIPDQTCYYLFHEPGCEYLYGTLAFALIKNKGVPISSYYIKKSMSKKIFINVGNPSLYVKPSRVIMSMKLPEIISRGFFTISMSDYTTESEINLFLKELLIEVKKYN